MLFKKSNKNFYDIYLLVSGDDCYVAVYERATNKCLDVQSFSSASAEQYIMQLSQDYDGNFSYHIVLSHHDYQVISLAEPVDHIADLDSALPWLCVDYLNHSPESYYYSRAETVDPKKPRVYVTEKKRVRTIIQSLGLKQTEVANILFYDLGIANFVLQTQACSQPLNILIVFKQQVRLLQLDQGELMEVANLPLPAKGGYEEQIFLNQIKALCQQQEADKASLVVINTAAEMAVLSVLAQQSSWNVITLDLAEQNEFFAKLSCEQQHLLAAVLGTGKFYHEQ